jgi:outer membrane protein TolC
MQEGLLAEVDAAVSRCRGAALESTAADAQVTLSARASALAQAAFQRGETSGLEPALAELAVVRAERLQAAARAQVAAAGGALVSAVGNYPDLSPERWPDPREEPLTEGVSR